MSINIAERKSLLNKKPLSSFPGGSTFLVFEYLSYGAAIIHLLSPLIISTLFGRQQNVQALADAWQDGSIFVWLFLLFIQIFALRELAESIDYGRLLFAMKLGQYYLFFLTFNRTGVLPILLVLGYQVLTTLLFRQEAKAGQQTKDWTVTRSQNLFSQLAPAILNGGVLFYIFLSGGPTSIISAGVFVSMAVVIVLYIYLSIRPLFRKEETR